jgi:DNA invertase Pin-like site-specific DNA recombinase
MKAYAYARYSSDAQKHGTSIDRQQTLARKWCKENNVELSHTVYSDEAVSGFEGANAKTGALGKFIADREAGDIEAGSILILEHLDRLTRMEPWDAVGLLSNLAKLGITVVTLRPEMKFLPEKRDSMQLLQAVLFLDNAHKESARKSDLGKIEWAKRFARARDAGHHIGGRVSNWLTLDKLSGTYYLNEHIFAVGRIFELCLEGLGSTAISQTLNAEGYRTLNKGERWGTTAVLTILQNRAAIGELALKDGGEPIPNYFPAVVHEDTFKEAQTKINARKTGKVTKQSADFNVWQKLVFCGACGSAMHIIKRNHRYLMCANRRYGECEGAKNVRLDESEDVFKAMLAELNALSLVMPDPDKLHRELGVAEGKLLEERRKLAGWVDKLRLHPDSPTYNNMMLESERLIVSLQGEIARLTGELTSGDKLNWAELQARIDLTDKNTRKRSNAFLHRLGVQVRIAEGYLVIQRDEARALFVVSKGQIGYVTMEGDGEIPDSDAANATASELKTLLGKPGSIIGRIGTLTTLNGRGTRRKPVESTLA